MTYSLVAFDPDTGECGVAVQSHWFSVGSLVTWAEPGVGAVATQAAVEVAYGPDGLARMREGRTAPEALSELLAADARAASRQVAMVDARGGVAAHTGSACMPFAGQEVGHHHSAQGNLMATEAVWGAMSEAYLGAGGPLAERLLAALDAGEEEGGDVRGRQSAALLVVPAAGERWRRTVELRVEDHVEPLREMRRLLGLNEGYVMIGEADEAWVSGDHRAATEAYIGAWERVPENDELMFWAGLSMFDRGEPERGAALLREAIEFNSGWARLLERLGPEAAPSIEEARLALGQGPGGAGSGDGDPRRRSAS